MTRIKLKDIAVENKERVDNPSQSSYDVFVGLEHYDSGEMSIRRYGSTERLESTMKVFHAGDILIARRNVYLKRAATVNFDGLTSGDSIVLHIENETYRRIMPFVLNTDEFWNYANQHADGSMSKRLSPKLLMEYEFSLPENNIEKASDILWAMERVKNAYRELIARTDDLVKSQFIELFGDYKCNSKDWPILTFDKFASIDANMTTDYEKYADYPHIGIDSIEKNTGVLSGYRTVREDNVISGKYMFTKEHIIYSKIRPNLNKVALPDFDGLCSADAYPILPKEGKTNRVYLASLLRSEYFLSYILGFSARSNMPKVNRQQIAGFKAPLPPLALQNKFAEFYEQSDKSKFAAQQTLKKLTDAQKALMKKIFE